MSQQPQQDKKGRVLNDGEGKELREGQWLYEITKMPGWSIMQEMFANLAFHSWSNPREAKSMEEWNWMELNSYYAANNAKEFLEEIERKISRSEYLDKVQKGLVADVQKMKI